MADPNHIPEFYQNHHDFLELAEKVISDFSFVRFSYHADPENPSGRLTQFLGPGVRHVTTNCILGDVMSRIDERAVFPYDEILTCLHGLDAALPDECIRSVLGLYNPGKVVVASEDNGAALVEGVRGLPVVVCGTGAQALGEDEEMGFLAPSQAQLDYVANTNNVAGERADEKARMLKRKERLRQKAVKKGIR